MVGLLVLTLSCLSLFTGSVAVEPHCSVNSDGSSNCVGNTAMLQVKWHTEANVVNHSSLGMLSTDSRATSNLEAEVHDVCKCTKPKSAPKATACDDCYVPTGDRHKTCVHIKSITTECPGCTEDTESYHCPDKVCKGHLCQGKAHPPPPVPDSCKELKPSEVAVPTTRPFQGWYDVQGSGQCNDWCHWHGCNGHGPDPTKHITYVGDSNCVAYWSCKLSDSSERETECGHFKASSLPIFNFPMCTSKGARAPPLAKFSPYVPGERGAPWTKEEMMITRARVREMFARGHDLMKEAGIDGSKTPEVWWSYPSAAKVLRLGFHDCLKYKDGTGGCDGCLNWQGVGVRFPRDSLGRGLYERSGDNHNNGLMFTVEVLERIYTDRTFPSGTPLMPISLQQSGKSRADLWAFATMDAVEYSIERNNHVCNEPEIFAPEQCHPRAGQTDCTVQMKRAFRFKTGRRDCSCDFKTYKKEVSPDAEANGASTVKFFQEQFNFKSGEDVVAIMGAHTLGRPHVTHSLFRYVWKAYSGSLFNNGYFRNLAKKEDWFFASRKVEKCADRIVGNATGQRPIARWVTHVRGDTKVGGPVQWIQQKLVCPNCREGKPEDQDCCSKGVPKDGECRPDCQKWKFVMGLDETMLPCEMGLLYDFQVDSNGIPSGCPGLEGFNMEQWGGWLHNGKGPGLKNYHNTWSRINGKKDDPQCPLNEQTFGGSKPLHEIVEEFANDQPKFIRAFMHALERMVENGYGQKNNELDLAPEEGMRSFACYKEDSMYRCESK